MSLRGVPLLAGGGHNLCAVSDTFSNSLAKRLPLGRERKAELLESERLPLLCSEVAMTRNLISRYSITPRQSDFVMHISEGILATPVLVGGAALTAAGLGVALKKLNNEDIPKVGVLSAGFFVAGLIHVPIGVASVHLVLNGLIGLILGWLSFPAIFVGLLLQSIMFQYGGITALGVNTFNMAVPALVSYFLFGRLARRTRKSYVSSVSAFLAGSLAIFLSGIFVGFSLYLTGEAFLPAAKLLVAGHIPVMLIEGIITAACLTFLKKVKPELLSMT